MNKDARFLVYRIVLGTCFLVSGALLVLDMYQVPEHRAPAAQGMLVGALLAGLSFSNAKLHLFRS
jgi:hypothetical protein